VLKGGSSYLIWESSNTAIVEISNISRDCDTGHHKCPLQHRNDVPNDNIEDMHNNFS
jgi:hypothetical protein